LQAKRIWLGLGNPALVIQGLLLVVDRDLAIVNNEELGEFYQSCTLTMKSDGFQWMLFNIYGPSHDGRKRDFFWRKSKLKC
jgi:hypothetical protein